MHYVELSSCRFDYVTDEGPMKMLQDIVGEEIVAPVRPNLTIPYWNFGFWSVLDNVGVGPTGSQFSFN